MADAPARDTVVSSETEQLILVDDQDREIGHDTKAACHNGHGILHRAFSLFVFNQRGELLLQQRSAGKRLWPRFWANSCCSHPRRGESMEIATRRRLREELGLECELKFLYKFQYQADYDEQGAEHELCWVYVGSTTSSVRPNTTEVADWRFAAPNALDREIALQPQHFTPWLHLEWQRLRTEFKDELKGMDKDPSRA